MWHEIFIIIDWRAVFNAVLVGMGGICIWIFKYHYQRFMAAHDLQRKADADWRESVNTDIVELKRICYSLDPGSAPARKENGVDKHAAGDGPHGRDRGRVRDS